TIYTGDAPSQCEYTMWYTAFRGWDFVPFLRLVELRLNYGEDTIASAKYKHTGGFALNKWASTESKLSPLFDKLLTDFRAK
ncbi:MAG: hypothetical protein ACXWTL_11320, partial [Methylobacter sp.]